MYNSTDRVRQCNPDFFAGFDRNQPSHIAHAQGPVGISVRFGSTAVALEAASVIVIVANPAIQFIRTAPGRSSGPIDRYRYQRAGQRRGFVSGSPSIGIA